MVRLSDAFTPARGSRTPREESQGVGESLPEVNILTGSQDVLDLVRQAVEERGYRIHHSTSADEVLTRLKVVGRILLVVDGNIEGVDELLRDPQVSDRPILLLMNSDQIPADRFSGLTKSRILTYPVDPAALLYGIQELSRAEKPTKRVEHGRVFSSLPGQPPAAQTVTAAPTPADVAEKIQEEAHKPVEAPPTPPTSETPAEPPGGAAKISELISSEPPSPGEAAEPALTATIEEGLAPAEAAPSAAQLEEFEKVKSEAYSVAVEAVRQFMNGHRNHTNPPLGDVAKAVEGMIKELEVSNNLALEVIHHTPNFDDLDEYLAHHLVNTTHLSITLGKGLKYSPKKLFELALATSIHDVGETQLPEGLTVRHGKLDQSGYSQLQQHPVYARELLQPYAQAYPWLPDVIYQEHERYDGSGYPEGLSGDDIHPYARIIGLADTYEALTHSRPFREEMIPFNVLQQLIRLGGRLFHSDLVKTLIDQISVFPLGSKVLLNTGEIGKVVQINKGYPLRPLVQVLFASDGSPLEQGRSIDLKAEPMLYITGPAEDQE